MSVKNSIKVKNLSKAIMLGLIAAGCAFGFANNADAANYISADAKKVALEKAYYVWVAGGKSITVKNSTSLPKGFKAYNGNMVSGGMSDKTSITGKTVLVDGGTVKESIYGAISGAGKVYVNTVTVKNGKIGEDIYGGQSESGAVENNTINLTNTAVTQDVCGGSSDIGIVKGNKISITGGSVAADINGGMSSASVSGNTVTIKGSKLGYGVYGGQSECANACDNKVSLTNSGFAKGFGKIFGGKVESNEGSSTYGKANGNTVTISANATKLGLVELIGGDGYTSAQNNKVLVRGTISDSVNSIIGGNLKEKGLASNNLVLLEGIAADFVTGGRIVCENGTANKNYVVLNGANITNNVNGGAAKVANNNEVVLVGNLGVYDLISQDGKYKTTVNGSKGSVVGGTIYGGCGTGNTLKVIGTGSKAGNIADFQKIEFTLPKGDNKNKDLLVINAKNNEATTLKNVKGITVAVAPGAVLNKDSVVNLIHKKDTGALNLLADSQKSIFDEQGKVKSEYSSLVVMSSPLSATSGKISLAKLEGNIKNDLIFTASKNINTNTNGEIKNNAKSIIEPRANAVALLNEGADFLLQQGLGNAKDAVSGNNELAPFAAIGGGNMRYKTGSHIDSKSWHGVVGVSKQVGDLLFGVALEHGKSNYDAYVNTAHGEGDSKATGGAVFAEVKKDSGLHYDFAVRAGRIKNDYNAKLSGFDTSYDESSAYYGVSVGGGKILTISDKATLDLYGRYYWSHTNSSNVSTNFGDILNFDNVNSHRTRIGTRYTCDVDKQNRLYAGLAWQYEFSGKVNANANSYNVPAPSLKGSSAVLELGWKVEASKNLTIDLNANGWTGKQKGVAGGVNLQWKF